MAILAGEELVSSNGWCPNWAFVFLFLERRRSTKTTLNPTQTLCVFSWIVLPGKETSQNGLPQALAKAS
jgi:hypothetical protein